MSNLTTKNTKFTILEIGNFNIDLIKKEVDLFDNEWHIDTSRQDKNMVHKNTKMYQILYCSYDWMPFQPLEVEKRNSLKTDGAKNQLADIFNQIESFYNGKVVRAEIIRMMPNTKIPRHVDGGEMLTITRRCHIPITTDDNIFFNVFGNSVNMKAGVGYEINNLLPHSVENNSNIERDHLILDILPLEMLQ